MTWLVQTNEGGVKRRGKPKGDKEKFAASLDLWITG